MKQTKMIISEQKVGSIAWDGTKLRSNEENAKYEIPKGNTVRYSVRCRTRV
jgi:hypothetical protein